VYGFEFLKNGVLARFLEMSELIVFLYRQIRRSLLKQGGGSVKIRWISTPIFNRPYNLSQGDKSH